MPTNQPNQPQGMPDFLYANNPFDRKDIGVWDSVSKDTAIKYVRADTKHQEALDALKECRESIRALRVAAYVIIAKDPQAKEICEVADRITNAAIQNIKKILNEHEKH